MMRGSSLNSAGSVGNGSREAMVACHCQDTAQAVRLLQCANSLAQQCSAVVWRGCCSGFGWEVFEVKSDLEESRILADKSLALDKSRVAHTKPKY